MKKSWLIWVQGCLVGVWLLNSNSFPPPFCFSDTTFALNSFSLWVFVFKTFDVLFYQRLVDNKTLFMFLMAFAETGTFNINDGRNANKNYLLSSDSQSDGLCAVRNRANQPWMKTSTCRTAHTWKNMIRGSWLDVSLFPQVGKAIRDIWLVYIGRKIYSAAFQCENLSVYSI